MADAWQDTKANKQQQANDDWQKMLQTALLATMMDNKTALGYGLGTLIFNGINKYNNRDSKQAMPNGSAANMYGGDGSYGMRKIASSLPATPTNPTSSDIGAGITMPDKVNYGYQPQQGNSLQNYQASNGGANMGSAFQMPKDGAQKALAQMSGTPATQDYSFDKPDNSGYSWKKKPYSLY